MITKEFIASMKARLLADKAKLELDLADFGKKNGAKKPGVQFEVAYPESGGASEDDNASEVSDYADELSIVAKLESELRDTIKALAAIEKGTYGTCKYCGKEIDIKRLEARPTSSTDIACKKTLTQEL